MLFKQQYLEGIKSGKITLAFRKWKKPGIKKGSLIKTTIGIVEIKGISEIEIPEISEDDSLKAGFASREKLLKQLDSIPDGTVYRIEVGYHSPDPRLELRNRQSLSKEEFEQIRIKLERLDAYSRVGPWTNDILEAIRDHPGMKAADLAVLTSRQKPWLKLNIRKLKELGLTISHNPGYEISPLGLAYMSYSNEFN